MQVRAEDLEADSVISSSSRQWFKTRESEVYTEDMILVIYTNARITKRISGLRSASSCEYIEKCHLMRNFIKH